MAKQDIAIQRFYRSDAWKIARAIKIANVCGVCEECGAVRAEELPTVHLNDSELVPFIAALSQGLSPWWCFWKACGSGLGSLS